MAKKHPPKLTKPVAVPARNPFAVKARMKGAAAGSHGDAKKRQRQMACRAKTALSPRWREDFF